MTSVIVRPADCDRCMREYHSCSQERKPLSSSPHIHDSRDVNSVQLPDGPARIVRVDGVPGLSAAHVALFTAVRRLSAGPVLVMGPGAVPTALWAARAGRTLHHMTDSAAEALALAYTLSANDLPTVPSTYDWSSDALNASLGLIHLPRGRDLQRDHLRFATYHVRPGGRLVLVGAKNEGIRTAVDDAALLLGRAGVVARKGGYHAAMGYRPETILPRPTLTFETYDVVVDDILTELVSCAGAFARDRVDGGAAALIEAMQINPGESVLEIGTGTGLVALAAARRGAMVAATDVSYRAVASARRTLDANGYGNVNVAHAHGAGSVDAGTVDVVVSNPPFHRGHDVNFEVSQLFVREAARVLRPDGRLFLVANAFLDYSTWLHQHFSNATTALETPQFRVWCALKAA